MTAEGARLQHGKHIGETMLIGKFKDIARRCAYAALLSVSSVHAGALEVSATDAWAFKFTPSYYVTTHTKDASDLNLRANQGAHAIWLGYYRRGSEFEQTRTGYEYSAKTPFGQLVPSLQLASHGFAGGSLNAQVGNSIYALLGFGRTNTRDYYNLNFDPNDAVTYGLGTSLLPRSNVSLFTVKDNRLHTGQIVTHLVWRLAPEEQQQWIVDLSSKHGRATVYDESVSGLALAVTYDYRNVFFRLVQDRKVNFSTEDQTRLSIGLRF